MKTSLDLSEHLFTRIKQLARSRGTSVRALVEEGLRLILSSSEERQTVHPKLLTFGGDGLTDQFQSQPLSWEQVRDEIYRGHGS